MSRLSWRDEERLRDKIARLEEQLDQTEASLTAERSDHADTHRALEVMRRENQMLWTAIDNRDEAQP